MPEPEQNRKSDALLRAYAKQARPEALLHPASRRILQDEVKRTFGGEEARKAKKGPLSFWWVRGPLAIGFAACAVLLIVQNRRFEEAKGPRQPAATMDYLTAQAPPTAEKKQKAAPAMPAPGAAPSEMIAGVGGVPTGTNAIIGGDLVSAEAPNMPASRALRFRAATLATRSNGTLVFVSGAPAGGVLQTFQVERSGSNVTIRDGDGSVYLGQAAATPSAGAGGEYSFAVHGVNRSTQQSVDFEGRLGGTAASDLSAFGGGGAFDARKQNGTTRVSGTATVAGTNQFKVEAVPAAPK